MYLVDMYVGGRLEEQGRCQAKGRTQQATSNEQVQKAEGDQHCCAHSQAWLISQLLYPSNSVLRDSTTDTLAVAIATTLVMSVLHRNQLA